MVRKIIKKVISYKVRKNGMNYWMGNHFYENYVGDIVTARKEDLKLISWAHKHGFLGFQAMLYGLNEDNYNEYINDFDYVKLFPLNDEMAHWINDKLTFRYILEPFKQYLPKYYFYINGEGTIKALQDGDIKYGTLCEVDTIIGKLQKEGSILAKPIAESASVGVVKLEYFDGEYRYGGKVIDYDALREKIANYRNYIVEEFIVLTKKVPVDNLRVIVGNNDNCPKILSVKNCGIEHIYADATDEAASILDMKAVNFFTQNINLSTGESEEKFCARLDLIRKKKMIQKKMSNYIDKDCDMFKLPYWDEINKVIIDISNYLMPLKYMGFDVMITDEGFKILEINSHCGIQIQIGTPFLKKGTETEKFFRKELHRIGK